MGLLILPPRVASSAVTVRLEAARFPAPKAGIAAGSEPSFLAAFSLLSLSCLAMY